jgi:hypothetical protein
VATHGGPGTHSPDINQGDLRDEFGDQLVAFIHVDSRPSDDGTPGSGIDQLRSIVASTAFDLPEMGSQFPKKWTQIRSDLTPPSIGDSDTDAFPYLSYDDFERIATFEYGLDAEAAFAVFRIAVLRGQWISCGQTEDPKPGDLIITQPEWLAKAISFVIDDPNIRRNGGLLQENRLDEVWNNSDRDRQYDETLYPAFLQLMKDFEIAYEVQQTPADEAKFGPRWLVAQLVDDRPDPERLRSVQPDGATPVLRRVVRFAAKEDGDPFPTPEGLLFRLIVRLHRYSLGAQDHREAVHWKTGAVFFREGYGHVEVGADRERLTLAAWGEQPERLITMVVDDVEESVSDFWPGVDIVESATCRADCPRQTPGAFEFDMIAAYRMREIGGVVPCTVPKCGAMIQPESLISGYDPAPTHDALLGAVALGVERVERGIDRLEQGQRDSNHTRRELLAGQRAIKDSISDVATLVESLRKDKPGFIVPRVVDTSFVKKGVVRDTVALEVYCEHSGKPLRELDENEPERGYYEFPMHRSYVQYVGPAFNVLTKLATGLSVGVGTALEGALDEDAFERMEFDLEAAGNSVKVVQMAGGAIDDAIDLDTQLPIEPPTGRPTEKLAIEMLQELVRSKDPTFGRLAQRQTTDGRVIWVAEEFGGLYREPGTQSPSV